MGEEGEKEEEMDVEEVSESTIGFATQSISPTIVNNTSNTAKEETADETSDDEAQGAVIDNIIDRVANKEVPLALPSQQKTKKRMKMASTQNGFETSTMCIFKLFSKIVTT